LIVVSWRKLWFVFAGNEFRLLVDKYLRQGLHKGVPPLFVDLRSLYKDPEKVDIIERLVLLYVDALQKVGRFSEGGNWNECNIVLVSQLLDRTSTFHPSCTCLSEYFCKL